MAQTKFYLLHIVGDVEPVVVGPFDTESERDERARQLRAEDIEGRSGLFWLDATGKVEAGAYQEEFLRPERWGPKWARSNSAPKGACPLRRRSSALSG